MRNAIYLRQHAWHAGAAAAPVGFDTLYSREHNYHRLFLAARMGRILLTRETHIRAVLSRHQLDIPVVRIQSEHTEKQLQELFSALPDCELHPERFFTRCPVCNGLLAPVEKEQVKNSVPPRTYRWCDDYFKCEDCGKIYWEGTHIISMRKRFAAYTPTP